MPNNQFRAIPSSTSRSLDITSSNTQIQNGDSNSKYPTRDCTSSNSTSTTTDNSGEPLDYQYEDGALPSEETEETNGEEENYSNLDLNTVKLFVGQIPYSYSEDNLYPLFSQFGPVAEIVVIRDRFTFKSRGCAFVSFRNKQDADSCIRELNQRLKLPPLNTPLRVKYAYTEQQLDNFNDNFVNNAPNLTTSSSPNDSNSEKSQDLTIASNFLSCLNIDKYEIGQPHPENKLFIRNIPKSVTEDELSALFESFGEILDVVVLRTTIHTSKGCGFIKFTNSESADMVINTFKREIIAPIQEYQQGAQQEGTTLGGPSNQRLVELTNKLLESSFLMKGAITPLLVRYADNDFAQQSSQDQEHHVTNAVSTYDSNGNNGYHPRRRKSYPFSYNNRRGSFHQQAQHYHYQNPYYDHSNGYPHGGMYQPNYYGYPGQGQDGVSTTDTVYFYHLYNNPYGATGTTTTTITAPSETIGNSNTNNGYSTNNGSEIKATTTENGPSPVPPMYYYYPPYYYHPQYANGGASGGTSNGGGGNVGINNNNGNTYHHQQHHYSNKYSSHNSNNNYVKNKYKSSSTTTDRKNVTKCTSDA